MMKTSLQPPLQFQRSNYSNPNALKQFIKAYHLKIITMAFIWFSFPEIQSHRKPHSSIKTAALSHMLKILIMGSYKSNDDG